MVACITGKSDRLGWLIGFWPQTPDGGYAPAAYQVGFGFLLSLQILAFIWFIAAGRDTVRTPA